MYLNKMESWSNGEINVVVDTDTDFGCNDLSDDDNILVELMRLHAETKKV
jgi:hypothetical protein